MAQNTKHPIDIVEAVASEQGWEFDRVGNDVLAMVREGQWHTYSLTIYLNSCDDTLRFICAFEMLPPVERFAALFELLNYCNDLVWTGAFHFIPDKKLMVWRYALVLDYGQVVTKEQVQRIVTASVQSAERFYPTFQLVNWGDKSPQDALKMAMTEAYGRA